MLSIENIIRFYYCLSCLDVIYFKFFKGLVGMLDIKSFFFFVDIEFIFFLLKIRCLCRVRGVRLGKVLVFNKAILFK